MTAPNLPHLQDGSDGAASEPDVMTSDGLLESALAFWRSTLLLTAHELGVFAELARGPRAAQCLGSHLGLRREAIVEFLDALVLQGFLARSAGLYHNTSATDRFLDPQKPSYMGHWFDMARAAQRDALSMPDHLRDAGTGELARTLAEHMWADIAATMHASGADKL